MGKLRDVKQIGDKPAHHLSGVIFVIVGKREIFIVFKQLSSHVPFHPGAHDMSLAADIILAQGLQDVEDQEDGSDDKNIFQDNGTFL